MSSTLGVERTDGFGRFGARSLLGLFALLVGAVPFVVLMLLVQRRWAPLEAFDGSVAAELTEAANRWSVVLDVLRVVTHLGGNATALYVFLLTLVCWWIRGQRRLAAYVAVTGVTGFAWLLICLRYLLLDPGRRPVEAWGAALGGAQR